MWRTIGLFGAGLLTGIALGWLTTGSASSQDSRPATAAAASPPAHVPPAPSERRPMICATSTATLDAQDLRLRWCEARLGTALARAEVVRLPWPEGDLGGGDPSMFADLLDQTLSACGGHLEVSDCSEYPCAAVLGGVSGVDEVAARCPGIEALPDIELVDVRIRCPSGSVRTVPVAVSYDAVLLDEQLAKLGVHHDGGLDSLFERVRLMDRRADEAVSLAGHLCE